MLCPNCGETLNGARVCGVCSSWGAERGPSPPRGASFSALSANIPYKQSIDYTIKLKSLARGIPFITGCILITLAAIAAAMANPSFMGMLDLAIAGVHIVALWLLVFESFASSDSCKKTLTALLMFRVSAILSMVAAGIVLGGFGLMLLVVTMQGIGFVLLFAIVVLIGYIYIKYYFLALLKMLTAIRVRIESGQHEPLDGLNSFAILAYIGVAIGTISALIENFTLLGIISFFSYAGGIFLCISVLRRFE